MVPGGESKRSKKQKRNGLPVDNKDTGTHVLNKGHSTG